MKARDSDRSLARVSLFLHGVAVFVVSLALVSATLIGGPAVASTVEGITEIKPGFDAPVGVVVTPDGSKVYVANRDNNTVSVIDTSDNSVATVFDPSSYVKGPWGVAVNPAGTRVYVTNSTDGSVSVIDTSVDTVTTRISVENTPVGLAVTPDGTKVYVANRNSDSVSVIYTLNNSVTTVNTAGEVVDGPWGVAVAPDGRTAYVTNFDRGSVSVISTANDRVTTTIPVGVQPRGIAVNPAGTRVYVANWGAASVNVINTLDNSVSAPIGVGTQPVGVAVNPAGTRAYVTRNGSTIGNTVSVIDALNNSVLDPITVALGPWGVAINPSGTRVYVANRSGDSVSVISLALPPSLAVAASEVSAGAPGIFLHIAASPGRSVEGTPVFHGSAGIAPNTSYTLSIQSMGARALTRTVLATGVTNGRGHAEGRIEMGALAPGSYKIVMTGYHALAYPLVLTNHIVVDAAGKFVSVSAESQQPILN